MPRVLAAPRILPIKRTRIVGIAAKALPGTRVVPLLGVAGVLVAPWVLAIERVAPAAA